MGVRVAFLQEYPLVLFLLKHIGVGAFLPEYFLVSFLLKQRGVGAVLN